MASAFGFWMTISKKSECGATMISCFFDLIRRKVRSFCGSRSLTTDLALCAICVYVNKEAVVEAA